MKESAWVVKFLNVINARCVKSTLINFGFVVIEILPLDFCLWQKTHICHKQNSCFEKKTSVFGPSEAFFSMKNEKWFFILRQSTWPNTTNKTTLINSDFKIFDSVSLDVTIAFFLLHPVSQPTSQPDWQTIYPFPPDSVICKCHPGSIAKGRHHRKWL